MSAKAAKARADKYWRLLVKAPQRCARCGDTSGPFEAAHLIPRRFSRTRCVQDNGVCACIPCHRLIDSMVSEKVKLAHAVLGQERWEELERLSLDDSLPRPYWPDEADFLRDLWRRVREDA